MAEKQADQKEGLQAMPMWAAISGKLTVGSVFGYMVGNFAKQVTDQMIMYAGCATLLVGGLAWMRSITINWKQIDADVTGIYNKAKDRAEEEGYVERIKQFLIRTVPLLGGFGAGFYFGFTNG